MSALVTPVGQRVIVQGISWDTYTCLLADFVDSSGIRIAYDQGTLELMAPSFNVQHAAAVRGQNVIDLDVDPPPDMIIEIDISHPSLDKFPIYAALGVPE